MVVSTSEKQIATLFRDEVDNQHLNQKDMAKDINVSPQLLSHMLNGRRAMGLDRVISIADYLGKSEIDFDVAAELVHTPKPLNRKRRDSHPLSKMVGQDKEEMERIEKEKRYEIWDLLSIPYDEVSKDERNDIFDWLLELKDEISAEIAVFSSVCDRYCFDSREVIRVAETRERDD